MSHHSSWIKVNKELVAKAIGELYFEEVLNCSQEAKSWKLTLSSGVVYTFQAWKTIWTHLRVSPETIERNGIEVYSAAQFFIDSQKETDMDDINLGNFLEELHNTLYSDLSVKTISAGEMVNLNGEELQAFLNGHPKILLNKGRMGWGQEAIKKYAPESDGRFKLHWMAIHHSLVTTCEFDYLDASLTMEAKEDFLRRHQLDHSNYHIIPIHPWQWDNILSIQFAGLLAAGKLIYLGEAGDEYRPQISIRTLSNVSRPHMPDIKLPVSILNTSCVRGITASTIETGKRVSETLATICQNDPILKTFGTEVLREKAGLALIHPHYGKVTKAPYRYHEYLGAIVRESAQSKLHSDEMAVITASLFYKDQDNKSLIGSYIEKSGLTTEEWLKRYFQSVVIPLYHLQLEYGVGIVAHGQNIVLKLKNFVPSGMFIKDFQGDLRLSTELPEKTKQFFGDLTQKLTRLPPHYLIHDLITGHFITVLRFVSAVMRECDQYPEERFYLNLQMVLKTYIQDKDIPEALDLLAPKFQKVLLNKVRFKIGYADTSERPLPLTGTQMINPMYSGTSNAESV